MEIYDLKEIPEEFKKYFQSAEIGLEKTYPEYLKKLLDVFCEVKRVMKKEGTCFINLGDSFGSGTQKTNIRAPGFEKSLMLIPERFAIAMLDSGWILRNKLIWCKENSMPESVQDRWKKAHEYIFFFVKNKSYYFDLDVIRTPHKQVSIDRANYETNRLSAGRNVSSMGEKYNRDKTNRIAPEKYYSMPARIVKLNPKGAIPPDYFLMTSGSNSGSNKEHFATYPEKLIIPLIKAGCPEGGLVLDPFFGIGTTGVVARKLGRNFLGIEINTKYVKTAIERITNINPMFW